jgi:D-arabinose 5-phosphate isomerase GutQ
VIHPAVRDLLQGAGRHPAFQELLRRLGAPECVTLSGLTLFDAISIAIMLYNGINADYFKMVHPGGGVGEMLKNK